MKTCISMCFLGASVFFTTNLNYFSNRPNEDEKSHVTPAQNNGKLMPGQGKAIMAGGKKVIAIAVMGNDNDVLHEWNAGGNTWVNLGRKVKSATVDHNNHIWTVEGENIYRHDGKKWDKMPGLAKAVVAGGTKLFNIAVWGPDNDMLFEYDYARNTWVKSGRKIKSVAVDKNNHIWTIEGENVFRYDGKKWNQMPGLGKAIAAGGDKVVAIAVWGPDNDYLFEWNAAKHAWVNLGRKVKSVAVDAQNTIWTIEGTNVYTYK